MTRVFIWRGGFIAEKCGIFFSLLPIRSIPSVCRVPQVGVLADLRLRCGPRAQVSAYRDLWHPALRGQLLHAVRASRRAPRGVPGASEDRSARTGQREARWRKIRSLPQAGGPVVSASPGGGDGGKVPAQHHARRGGDVVVSVLHLNRRRDPRRVHAQPSHNQPPVDPVCHKQYDRARGHDRKNGHRVAV